MAQSPDNSIYDILLRAVVGGDPPEAHIGIAPMLSQRPMRDSDTCAVRLRRHPCSEVRIVDDDIAEVHMMYEFVEGEMRIDV